MSAAQHLSAKGLTQKGFFGKASNPVDYRKQVQVEKDWQRHHLVPCVAMATAIADAAKASPHLVDALKYFTKWNINEKAQLLVMPTRKAYQAAYGTAGAKPGPKPTLSTLPCHQPVSWGHTVYNDKVQKQLVKALKNVQVKVKDHDVEAADIGGDLDAVRAQWQSKLEAGRDPSEKHWRGLLAQEPGAHQHFMMVPLPASPI